MISAYSGKGTLLRREYGQRKRGGFEGRLLGPLLRLCMPVISMRKMVNVQYDLYLSKHLCLVQSSDLRLYPAFLTFRDIPTCQTFVGILFTSKEHQMFQRLLSAPSHIKHT